jgi:hypothetical protein
MVKLLICLLSSLALAAAIIELRQQRLDISYQSDRLHNEIEAQQAKLWNQQLQIAVYTAPNAIARTVSNHALRMIPQSPIKAQPANWIDPTDNPDAE